jgi:hypothetical protein
MESYVKIFGAAVAVAVSAAFVAAPGLAQGVGAAAGGVGGVAAPHRPAIPLNTVTSPAAHTAGINGTTMGRVISSPNYIGGPAKDRSGINGTAVRPRH